MLKSISYIIFLLIVCTVNLEAQSTPYYEEWRWTHFTTESGLPSNSVYSIYESRDSTLWAITAGGIAWYDGYRWNPVRCEGASPTYPTKPMVEDGYGNLFIRIQFSLFEGTKSGFHMILSGDSSTEMAIINDTTLVVDFYEGNSRRFYVYQNGIRSIFPLPFNPVSNPLRFPCSWQASKDAIWMLSEGMVYGLAGRQWKPWLQYPGGTLVFNEIVENDQGDGAASIEQPIAVRGLWEWKHKGSPVRNSLQGGEWIRCMDISRDGTVLAVDRAGQVLERRNNQWHTVLPTPRQLTSVNHICYMSGNRLGISGENGVFFFNAGPARWSMDDAVPYRSSRVHELLVARDGSTWAATSDGLEIRTGGGSRRTVSSIDGAPIHDVTGLAEDCFGNIWISSGAAINGAYCWNGKRWHHELIDTQYSTLRVHKIRKDKHGRLWFLCMGSGYVTQDQPGAYMYDGTQFHHFGKSEGLPGTRVYDFAEGSDGAWWFGTLGYLSKFKNGAWTHWTCGKELPQVKVFALAVDSQRNVWLTNSTGGTGFLKPDGSFQFAADSDGYLPRVVSAISVDSSGVVWFGTEKGVTAFDHGRWMKFGVETGLRCANVWPVLPLGGRVLAGTLGGGLEILNRAMCDPAEVSIVMDAAVVEENKVYLHWIPAAHSGVPEPSEILTRYRLNEGLWSRWTNRHEATLVALQPGDYTMHVQARNLFHATPELIFMRSFTISPPFYLRTIFILPMSLVLIALLLLFVRSRQSERRFTRELQYREHKLTTLAMKISQTQEEERRSIATYLHDEISQALGYCKMKLGLIQERIPDQEVNGLHVIVSDLYEKARYKTFELSVHVLYELGIGAAIRVLAERMEEQYRIAVMFEEESPDIRLDDARGVIVFRAVQELLINVMKHAEANMARVRMSRNGEELTIIVSDDGRGIQPDAGTKLSDGMSGFGLFNLRERIGSLGGSVNITSNDEGTEVTMRIPIAASPVSTMQIPLA